MVLTRQSIKRVVNLFGSNLKFLQYTAKKNLRKWSKDFESLYEVIYHNQRWHCLVGTLENAIRILWTKITIEINLWN